MTASGGEVGRLSIVGGAEVRCFCFGTALFELRKANYLYQAISCVRAEQFILAGLIIYVPWSKI